MGSERLFQHIQIGDLRIVDPKDDVALTHAGTPCRASECNIHDKHTLDFTKVAGISSDITEDCSTEALIEFLPFQTSDFRYRNDRGHAVLTALAYDFHIEL